ncbi:MAG: bacillithiol biosynthesis BshC [Flavobacteriaceae bacterium]|nr:bacillithiol biosynthesis BshC [Flavobacteriaceae bacterium]
MDPLINTVTYQETGYFTKIIHDYLEKSPLLKSFYGNFPAIEQFQAQIEQKKNNYSPKTRRILTAQVEAQNSILNTTAATRDNIELLSKDITFTVVTGHQLNLNTGPLYFLYKIISTINLCRKLKITYPEFDFVPVFWMASEDHDFDEVNFFNYHEVKVDWNTIASGPVGRLKTSTLEKVYFEYAGLLGKSKNAAYLKDLFSESYLRHKNLAAATRFFVNELFGKYGLVILDGDDTTLKQVFSPYMMKDLLNQNCFHEVNRSTVALEENYRSQVNPREINLFYILDGLRERITLRRRDLQNKQYAHTVYIG